jgi:protein-S-isoprenylcysteine O-methyltransferase Ste14
MWLLVRNVIFTILVPGTVAVYIPYRIILNQYESLYFTWSLLGCAALILMAVGTSIYLWCLWDFAVTGRGTPNIVDAPRRLVVKGLYRYVRNPMYIGVLLVIMGWAALYESLATAQFALLMFVIFNGVIFFLEEPMLRERFGQAYEGYCEAVHRWIPGRGK